jgi:hypothetical protein
MNISCDFPDNILPIGTKVYLPRPAVKAVHEDVIVGYACRLTAEEGRLKLSPTDYCLTTINVERGGMTADWKRDEFFLSYEDALAMAVEYEVNATPKEWWAAIGLRGDETEDVCKFNEDCELPVCCYNISDIRDILYNVCVSGEINGVNRRNLIALLNSHEPPENKPILDKILAQLDINWTPSSKTNFCEDIKK